MPCRSPGTAAADFQGQITSFYQGGGESESGRTLEQQVKELNERLWNVNPSGPLELMEKSCKDGALFPRSGGRSGEEPRPSGDMPAQSCAM